MYDQRIIDCAERDMWNYRVIYNPMISFTRQIQENGDKKGRIFLNNRFTQLQINNLIIEIDSDTEIPYYNSPYTLKAYLKKPHRLEQITFRSLNGNKYYTSNFDNVWEVDKFLHYVYNDQNKKPEYQNVFKKILDIFYNRCEQY